MTTSLETFLLLAPEILLVLGALVAYLAAAFCGLRAGWLVALVTIGAGLALSGGQPGADDSVVSGPVGIDGFSVYIRLLVFGVGGLLALIQAGDHWRQAVIHGLETFDSRRRGGTCEEAGTFLLLLAGLSLVGVANDLVLLFVGLELVSIPTYILLALKRTDARGQEAALKYFFLSLVSSALFLYGLVCLYGVGGSTSLTAIGSQLRTLPATLPEGVLGGLTAGMAAVLLPVAIGMTLAGAAFRLAAVPMHFYAPDVYEGTSPANAALLATLPKIAGVVVLARIVALGVTPLGMGGPAGPAAAEMLELFWLVAALLAAVTMTVGNCMALVQNNLRRLLACSSIAHAGYLLVGLAAAAAAAATRAEQPLAEASPDAGWLLGLDGTSATLFYLATYLVATAGSFATITYLGHRWPDWSAGGEPTPMVEISTVEDLDGLSATNPVAAFSLAAFLLSLAGIPPLPGFWGKLSLATAALEVDWNAPVAAGSRRAWFVGLAVVLVLNAAIAAAYYLRLIAAIYFRSTKKGVQADGGLSAGVAMLACLILLISITARPRGLFSAAERAGAGISGLARQEPMAAVGLPAVTVARTAGR